MTVFSRNSCVNVRKYYPNAPSLARGKCHLIGGIIIDTPPYRWQIQLMQKLKPTYDLESFKAAFGDVERLSMTTVALADARRLGFSLSGIVALIQTMERTHFFKSMTSFADHREWQDVYHVPHQGIVIYLKFIAHRVTEFRLLSFKEK